MLNVNGNDLFDSRYFGLLKNKKVNVILSVNVCRLIQFLINTSSFSTRLFFKYSIIKHNITCVTRDFSIDQTKFNKIFITK